MSCRYMYMFDYMYVYSYMDTVLDISILPPFLCLLLPLVVLPSPPFSFRAREALRQCLPEQLKDSTFATILKEDSTTKKWLVQLLTNLGLEMVAVGDSRPAAPPTSIPQSQ